MIPVTQTKTVIKNSKDEMIVHGNCYAAAIASMLELPITEVPNVEVLFHIDDSFWFVVMQTFLRSRGYDMSTNNDFKVFHDITYCSENGERLWLMTKCLNKLYLVSGLSARGVQHICIYRNGNLVHDPHPSREGILTFEYFEEISKLKL